MIEDAVIIFKENSKRRILGLPIILRIILSGHQSGLKNFLIVGNGRAEEIKFIETLKLDKRVQAHQLQISYLPTSELNSDSSWTLHGFRDKNFWLIDGDLIFSAKFFEQYKDLTEILQFPIIFISRAGDFDKNSLSWSGLALCPGKIWPSLAMALARKDTEVLLLTASELFSEFSVRSERDEDDFLIRVRSKTDEKKVIQALLKTARKPQDGFIAKHFNRHISLFFTKHLVKLDVSPLLLSALNFFIGITGAILAGLGKGYWSFLAGGFLFEFSSIFDGCDGEVARLTYQTSKKGASFDVIFDALTYLLFFSGLAIGLYRHYQRSWYLILLGMFLLSLAWYYFNLNRYTRASGIGNKIFLVAKEVEDRARKEKRLSLFDRLASKLAFAVRRDFFATFVFLLIAAGFASPALLLVTGGALIESIYFHFYTSRQLKALKAQNRSLLT